MLLLKKIPIIIYFLFLTQLLFSCSHIGKKIGNDFHENTRSICLSGEGRGIIRFLSETVSFSFESVIVKGDSWFIGMDIPMMGEKVIKIGNNPFEVSGSLYDKILQQFTGNNVGVQDRKKMDIFLKYVALFLAELSDGRLGQKSNGSIFFWKIDDRSMKIWSQSDSKNYFIIETSLFNGAFFEKLKIGLTDDYQHDDTQMSIDLRFASCKKD